MGERMPNSIKALAIGLGVDGIGYWICITFLDLPDATMDIGTMVAAVVEMLLIISGAVIIIRDLKRTKKKRGRKERIPKGRQMMLMVASMLLGITMALTMILCFTDFMAGRVIFTVALTVFMLLCAFVLLFLSLRSVKHKN